MPKYKFVGFYFFKALVFPELPLAASNITIIASFSYHDYFIVMLVQCQFEFISWAMAPKMETYFQADMNILYVQYDI